jgi:SAM-dependent methyltransferase
MDGLFFVSDRYSAPDRSRFTPEGDTVYPAITKGTGRFVRMLPSTQCERLLDLCSGTGVAALSTVANGSIKEAWAIDVTERSSLFAEFNRRLNDVAAVHALKGDLYEPVRGMTFDRIVAHPPYVPAIETKWIFRDSGEIGEAITRRIIDNLPAALTPGGRLYCLTTGMERENEPYERRIRQWLGDQSREFDLLLVELESYTLEVLISALAFGGQRTVEECRDLKTRFEEVDAKSFFHGFVIIQRKSSPREVFTVRRKSGPESGSSEVEWLMGWLTRNVEPANRGELLATRFVTSEKCEMTVEHRMEDGEMAVAGMRLRTRHPFDMECRIQPWTGQFIAECGRPMTGQEIYDYCRREEIIRGQVTAQDFTALLDMLTSGGFLEAVGSI